MKLHAKASSSGSSTRAGSRPAAIVRGAFALALALAVFLGIGASAAVASEPIFSIEPVSAHGITTAKASGHVTFDTEANGGSDGFWYFQYCEGGEGVCSEASSWSYGPEAFTHVQAAGTSAAVEETLTGLKASTEYSVRLTVLPFNTGAELHTKAPYPTVTTDPAPVAPTATVSPATSISISSAQIQGAVDPEGGNEEPGVGFVPIHWAFALSPSGDPGSFSDVASGDLSEPESSTAIDVPTSPEPPVQLSGLLANHTYTYKLLVTYAGQSVESAAETFTTDPASNAPALALDPVSALARTHVHVSGTLDPEGGNADAVGGPIPIQWRFQYKKASEPGADWKNGGAGGTIPSEGPEGVTSSNPIAVSADFIGLSSGTEYLYRLRATYAGEETTSGDSFETLSSAGPDVVTQPATHVGYDHAFLYGTVNPREENTAYWFEYGTEDCSSATCTATAERGLTATSAGTESFFASQAIGGLSPSTTYHFRLLAKNASGTSAGADETFTTSAAPTPQSCANEALRTEQHAADLPDCRAWEMASPVDKEGKEIASESTRTHAAAVESIGSPAAVSFVALGGFGDVQGTGIGAEYMAQRTGQGPTGWLTHGITAPQEALSYLETVSGLEPKYLGEMSPDLTKGVYLTLSDLTDAPNVEHVANLYLREDLRDAGTGSYRLLSDASSLLPAATGEPDARLFLAATSSDFEHVLFETRANLTPDATGTNIKLYKWDGGAPRMVVAGPGCPGQGPSLAKAPCSSAGKGAFQLHYTDRALSTDGTRVLFTAPTGGGGLLNTAGAASKLYQLDDRGTASAADDALTQIDTSEATVPAITRAAAFQEASSDGSRIFFNSAEQLTDDAPDGGLYMWERQESDEQQQLTVDATGGTFTLTAHAQPSVGLGTVENGSTNVTSVEGAFSVGQAISGTGIPDGTTIVAVPSSTRLTLSAPATADGETALSASVDATTSALPHDASAAQVQAALEGLSTIGTGNVTVSGGPGGAGGATPYVVTFTGALSGINVSQLSADAGLLSGGAGTAAVATTLPVHNLTLITVAGGGVNGVIGASEDGHRLYFAASGGQLVNGAPALLTSSTFYYWQDVDGRPGGTLSFVGGVTSGGDVDTNANTTGWNTPKVSRVSPDGRYLLFEVSHGSGLAPGYDQSQCNVEASGNPNNTSNACSEAYLYSAETSTPTDPDLVCASCDPSGEPPTGSAWVNFRRGASATAPGAHLSHALSDDGRRIFFSSKGSLVPGDTNGAYDAYEYDVPSGTLHLISSGTDEADSFFMDASADGHDVYFTTRERLVGWDTDNAYDMYDARVGGGFPEPPPVTAPCQGETCRGAAPSAPGVSAPGSASLVGHGDPTPRRCPKGTRAVTRKGKLRCVKKQPKHPSRHANTDRRATR